MWCTSKQLSLTYFTFTFTHFICTFIKFICNFRFGRYYVPYIVTVLKVILNLPSTLDITNFFNSGPWN